jgi:pSer/pThr/pTyr-binding forkhead associated (FHA) protein
MVECPQCGHRNPASSNFCSSCGAPLPPEDHTENLAPVEHDADPNQHSDVETGDVPVGAGLLIVRHGPNAGSRYIVQGKLAAGRHPESDIFLDDITVSRRHAEIDHDAEGGIVRDVGSLNGTYVNHVRVDEGRLQDGDELQIGRFRFEYFEGPGAGE